MSRRQQQHHGRSAGGDHKDLDELAARGETTINTDPVAAAEDAREITRILDHEEGYERAEPKKNPM